MTQTLIHEKSPNGASTDLEMTNIQLHVDSTQLADGRRFPHFVQKVILAVKHYLLSLPLQGIKVQQTHYQ